MIQLLISGDAGPDYGLEASTNLVDWETCFTTNAPALPFGWADTNSVNVPARFYRALLSQ